jgi:phospholipid/cholesterol/gamma-HCH transport system substrate-binding protein
MIATMVDPSVRSRPVLLRRAIVGIVVTGLLGGLVLAYGKGMFADEISVTAVVDNAGGSLAEGSDVKSRGVIIGKVSSITAENGDVRIGLQLEGPAARRIPTSVQARVLPATVFGTTFVDLAVPDGADATPIGLAAGQEIRQDQSSPTIELQDTLDDTDRVLSAVKPAQLATTLSSVANALGGRGKELGGTIETLDAYLERLEPHLPLLQEVIRLAAIDLNVLAEVSPDLLASVDNALPTTRTIVAKQRELATTFTDAHELVQTADGFLRDQEKLILRTLANTATAFDALFDHRAGLADGFRSFIEFAERGTAAFSDGPFLHTDVFIKTGGDVPYSADDCPQYGPAQGRNCGGGASVQAPTGPATGLVPPGFLAPGLGLPDLRPGTPRVPESDTGLLGDIAGLLSGLGGAR